MIKTILLIVCLGFVSALFAQQKDLVKGMKITRSAKIRKASYTIKPSSDISRPVILIEGNNITVDFNHATLNGSAATAMPDSFKGLAVLVKNSRKVTIKNLNVRGYKVALHIVNVQELILDSCDLGYNYRPRLLSTQEKENMADWMSYHRNEKNEWLRYGAAIYLEKCKRAVVRNCKVTGGQNALMMTQTDSSEIYNNDFSFNSGIGIGMYRSNHNQVMHNRIIFNVRGYSHGVYKRGQDSAGILVYEQSSNNTFFRNNVTHGGDGFFLWAGQTTMDSGKGGCNDNLIIGNDFSYAPTNGIEVTFSRNKIMNNRIFECDHGIWGGYSYNTQISANQFRDNRIAIAIEHGQENEIHSNLFVRDNEAIRLWARKEQPADWGYAKNRDTRSRDYGIALNSFNDQQTVYNISRTSDLFIFDNSYSPNIKQLFRIDSTVTKLDTFFSQSLAEKLASQEDIMIEPKPNAMDPFKGSGKLAGRKNIMMTEWGPYDFQYPFIYHAIPVDKSDTMQFDIFGPGGNWSVTRQKGIRIVGSGKGNFPGKLVAIRDTGARVDISLELISTGPAFFDGLGKKNAANKPFKFKYRKFFQPVNWQVLFFSMDTAYHNPLSEGNLFSPLERKAPFKKDTTDRLEYAWWGGIDGRKQFITMADGQFSMPPGIYEIAVTWDDAVRVYLDNNLVLNEWNPGKYDFDQSPHKTIRVKLGGEHRLRVEHLELGGFATLALVIKPLEKQNPK